MTADSTSCQLDYITDFSADIDQQHSSSSATTAIIAATGRPETNSYIVNSATGTVNSNLKLRNRANGMDVMFFDT